MQWQGQRKVRAHLNQLSPELFRKYEHFEAEAVKLLEYAQAGSHLSYTTHGISHVRRVEATYDWLLGPEDIAGLSAGEAFCLLCATYSHDIFMIPRFLGDETRSRKDHASAAASELRRLQSTLGLSLPEATFIGEVIRAHHVEKIGEIKPDSVLGSDRIRLRLLGACLSMADICHADESRAPQIVFQYLSMDEESARHWKRHMQIGGINRSGDQILVSAISFSDEGEQAIQTYVSEIRTQLKRVSPYFHSQLLPIEGVTASIEQLESELDQKLSFKTNTTAVLDMLVSGVYQQVDVFIRELIQNALDATYIEDARCRRNGVPYRAEIAVTELQNASGQLLAVRIDDNGSGMGVAEIKDTLLWIGQSQNTKESVQELLKETGKSLIANFGIGLLSCFRVASSVVIRTQKGESGQSFAVQINGFGERISMDRLESDSGGTSVFVYLKPEFSTLKANDAARHYCRMVKLADIYLNSTRNDSEFLSSRRAAFDATRKSGTRIEIVSVSDGAISFEGSGYYCRLLIDWDKGIEGVVAVQGSLNILNDGIFICENKASDWLPSSLGYCNGFINFAAKAIDLPVSRDAVVENDKLRLRRNDLHQRANLIFEKIAAESNKLKYRDKVAIVFSYAMSKTSAEKRASLLRESGKINVKLFNESFATLESLMRLRPTTVFVTYKEGNWVDSLGKIDGIDLYYKRDALATMQAELAAAAGEVVIEAVRAERIIGTNDKLKEKDLIEAYFQSHNIPVVDLLETVYAAGNLRSLSIPRNLRSIVGRRVKFVEPGIQPSKVGWDLKDEVWLNVSNPVVRQLYERVKISDLSDAETLALSVLVSLIDSEFDNALGLCLRALS